MPTKQYKFWYNGMSENDYISNENQFDFAKGVDVRQDLYSLNLNRGSREEFTCNHLPLASVDNFFFCEDGRIYNDSGVEVASDATNGNTSDIKNAVKFNGYYYWVYEATDAHLARIDVNNADSDWAGSMEMSYQTLSRPENDGSFNMLNVRDDTLFVVNGNTISSLTSDGVFTDVITFEDDIVGLTRHGVTFSVYLANGLKAFWDGFSDTEDSATNLNTSIRYVYQQGNRDYVVGGFNNYYSILYVSQGYEIQKLRRFTESNAANKTKFAFGLSNEDGNQTMTDYNGKLFMPAKDTNGHIYSYGNDYNGFDPSFNIDIHQSHYDNDIDRIGMVKTDGTQLLYSYEDSNNNIGVDRVDLGNSSVIYNKSGFLYTNIYDGGDSSVEKQLEEIKISYSASGSYTIKLYVETDGDDNFTELTTLDDGSISEVNRKTLTSGTLSNLIQSNLSLDKINSWSGIQFKIEFDISDGATNTYTPKLYDLKFKYSTKNR